MAEFRSNLTTRLQMVLKIIRVFSTKDIFRSRPSTRSFRKRKRSQLEWSGGNRFRKKNARLWMVLILLVGDFSGFLFCGVLAISTRAVIGLDWQFDLFPQVLILATGCVIVYQLSGLYPAIGMDPVDEIRRLSITTTLVIIGISGLTFFARNAEVFSRLTFGFTWLFSLAIIPMTRSLLRTLSSRYAFWGMPIVIIGFGDLGQALAKHLLSNRKIGFDPVLIVDGIDQTIDAELGIPILPTEIALKNIDFSERIGVDTAMLVLSEISDDLSHGISQEKIGGFRHLIVVPDLSRIKSIGVSAMRIGSFLGLHARNNLFYPFEARVKRTLDTVLVIFGSILTSPLLFLIGLVIRLDSRGKIFYRQVRLGKNGQRFNLLKFRTMVENADQVLDDFLSVHPELRIEWEADHKLKFDPRITRFGKFLRRSSLDELPQLWNVWRGEMSLVGPRPIVEAEIERYGDSFALYKRVTPGITGLWQVSGRNNLPYDKRIELDEFYIRNWSVWLDFYILACTIWVVLRRDGAY